jgi:hypothetical protein
MMLLLQAETREALEAREALEPLEVRDAREIGRWLHKAAGF